MRSPSVPTGNLMRTGLPFRSMAWSTSGTGLSRSHTRITKGTISLMVVAPCCQGREKGNAFPGDGRGKAAMTR